MTYNSSLGLMSHGERLALARYRLKHTIPLPSFKPYETNVWTITAADGRSLNFRDIYEITKRNQSVALGTVAQDEAMNGYSKDYLNYLDKYRWDKSSWSFSLKVELSPAAEKILELTKDL